MKKNYPNLVFSETFQSTIHSSLGLKKPKISNFNKLTLYLSSIVLLVVQSVVGQVANYNFSQSAGTYTALTAPTTVHATTWDDNVASVAIPFTFTFNGTGYTNCNVSSNGFITFGATAPTNTNFTPLSNTGTYAGAISALGRDLINNNVVIANKTLGTAPNRTFVVEWKNARRYNTVAQAGDFNFQIILSETTNAVNIVYGACASAYAIDLPAQVGLRGTTNADFNNRTTAANWPASTAGGTNAATCNTGDGAGKLPTNGLTYTWTPSYCAPTYATGPASNDHIANVTLGTLNNSSGASTTPFYTYYNAVTKPDLMQSGTAAISVTVGSDANQYVAAWIDFNQDNIFQAGEGAVSANVGSNGSAALNIPVPAGALLGNTRMRIRGGDDTALTTAQACAASSSAYGETEDYIVNIIAAAPPTITSLGSVGDCVGNSITINGTNFTGITAANVKIGGTAVASITSFTGTQIIAVIGTGATGTVAVTTAAGTAASAATFTVNPLPANPANPTSNSPQCASPGVTLTRTGTPPAGETWYWQTAAAGTSTVNSGTTYLATTAGTYYIRSQNNTTGCWSAGAGSLAVTVTASISTLATVPSPANAATGICYSGTGEVSGVSWTAAAGATSYDVYFGAGSLPGSVTANQAGTTYATGALAANTTYYWKIVPRSACGATSGTPVTWTFTTAATPCYCTPSGNLNCASGDFISNVTLNTINNTTTCGAGGYTSFAAAGAQTTTVFKGSSYTLSLSVGPGSGTHGAGVWIDFNQNGSFSDAGEFFLMSNAINPGTTTSVSIAIPAGATNGTTKMRIRYAYNIMVVSGSGMSCTMPGTYGETEEYTLTIADLIACSAPTAQPTAVLLATPAGGTTMTGSFTAASPAPNSYLVVISTAASPPTPVNGTAYAVGGLVETGGYSVVDTDSNTIFSTSGLSPGTLYYIYVFSYNNLCSGGPLYYTTAPLQGSATTTSITPGAYCTAATTAANNTLYINDVAFLGTLQDVTNYGTGFSTSPLPAGYRDYTALATKSIQAQGEGMNVYVGAPSRGHWKAWIDWNKDGDFVDANELVYNSGSVGTSTTTFGFIIPATTAPGNYRIRVRVYNSHKSTNESYSLDYTPCETFDSYSNSGTWQEYGEAEDYEFTVVPSCSAIIKTVAGGQVCGSGTVNLVATGSFGTTSFKWYATETGGAALATTATGSWTTPGISTSTTYYVTAHNGSCESLVRTAVIAKVNPIPTLAFTPSAPEVCGENTILALSASGDVEKTYLVDEDFESGSLGVCSNTNIVSNGATLDAIAKWQVRTSTFVPAQQVWFPAISSGFGTNKFAIATSDIGAYTTHNAIVSPAVNSTNFIDLTLSFRIYFSAYLDGITPTQDYVAVEVNDGSGWTALTTYTTDQGIGTKFVTRTFNLAAYINKTNLQFRIRYYGEWTDGLAIDDIELYGNKPLGTAFNWTGTSLPDAYTDTAATIPYITGNPVVTVYVKPTLAQLEQGSYTFTANAILSNGCAASTPITITNKSKIWKGAVNSDWNNPNNWSPVGVPLASTCVIVPVNTVISGTAYDAFAKNVTVKSTGNLEVQSGNNLTITDWLQVDPGGIFNIKNTGSLVQINNVPNTGIMKMERISQPMYRLDYTYWNSPVTAASAFTLGNLTTATSFIYKYTPTQNGGNGIWEWQSAGSVMLPTQGYIARAPMNFPTTGTKQTKTVNFIGTPNNGDITMPISKGTNANIDNTVGGAIITDADDEWNLIGNPYPSAIDIVSFLNNPANTSVVDGTVYLWTHNTAPSSEILDPFYGHYVLNYTVTDYATVNSLGTTATAATGGPSPSKYIGAGQSFFVSAADAMPNNAIANVIFTNGMRVTNNNNNFMRDTNDATPGFDAQRLWLNLSNNNGGFSQMLVGYASGATLGWDRGLDGEALAGNAVKLYSLAENKKLTIQGRPWPFVQEDVVPLGFKTTAQNTYTIGIDHLDAQFNTQDIYLQDNLLNVIHNLKVAPYSFTAPAGTFDSRFVLRYSENTLSNDDFAALENSVFVFNDGKLNVKSTIESINEITVFDLLGRTLVHFKDVNANEFKIKTLAPTTKAILVKVELANGTIVNKKVIF